MLPWRNASGMKLCVDREEKKSRAQASGRGSERSCEEVGGGLGPTGTTTFGQLDFDRAPRASWAKRGEEGKVDKRWAVGSQSFGTPESVTFHHSNTSHS